MISCSKSNSGSLKVLDACTLRPTNESDWATTPFHSVAGIGFCENNGHVFVSTWNKYIFSFNRKGEMLGQWRVEAVASGVIAVTDDCNIVLAVRDSSKKLMSYSSYGEIMNDIVMKADNSESRLIKAAQISRGHFLVSYGEGYDPVHGIAIINANDYTLESYSEMRDGQIGQLSDPRDFVLIDWEMF